MNSVQRYIFFQVLRAVLIIVGGLALLAILAQGLSQTDLILENRQSALTYFYIVGLGAPQIIALLTPLALFVAGIWSLNRIHSDSEIVVAQAAGMTRWQIASPILRLAVILMAAHLVVNLWVQPLAQREMREAVDQARGDLAATLIRPGQFTNGGGDRLTFYARDFKDGELKGVMISDATDPEFPVEYLARSARVIEIDGKPNIMLTKGQVLQKDESGQLQVGYYGSYTFPLADFLKEDSDLKLKASDKFLYELFFIDRSNYFEAKEAVPLLAEAHARLTSPLLNIVMALLAIFAVLGGDFSRRGYGKRIGIITGFALFLIVVQLALQSAASDDEGMNIALWLVPLMIIAGLSYVYFSRGRNLKREQGPRLGLRAKHGLDDRDDNHKQEDGS